MAKTIRVNDQLKRKAFQAGLVSLIDLTGETSYRQMQAILPPPRRTSSAQMLMQARIRTGQALSRSLKS